MALRVAACGVAVLGVILAVASCDGPGDGWGDHRRCDYVVGTQCQTVCDYYYCDYYQCYPSCYDQCWDECGQSRRVPFVDAAPSDGRASIADGAAPKTDGGVSGGDAGSGVLCSPCVSNADCEQGALCILRGGAPRDGGTDGGPVGRGFCGHDCTTSADCPADFLCSQIGSTRQCLPTGNACGG